MQIEILRKHLQEVMSILPYSQAALVPLIQLVLKEEGGFSPEMYSTLSEICNVPVEQVEQVVSGFQSSQPAAQPCIRVCGDLVCSLNGSREVYNSMMDSCPAGASVSLVSCPGYCHAAPVVLLPDGAVCKAVPSTISESSDTAASIERHTELTPTST